MATDRAIQDYIREAYGFTAKTCWIADVKARHGIPMRIAPNRENPNKRKHPCPDYRVAQVENALRHFGMIE